jgi:hypothetical protein
VTIQRLREAIEGERRDWHVVEVRPDDIAALLDIAEAARTIADGGWVDTDGETGDQWCHWCEAMDGHHEGCWFVDLRAALDRLEEVGS